MRIFTLSQIHKLLFTCMTAALLLNSPLCAQAAEPDEAAATEAVEKAATDETTPADEIKKLVRQLNDDKFQVREDASRRLTEAGAAAVNALGEATGSQHLEVVSRSFDILNLLMTKGDFAARDAAGKKLQEIAAGDNAQAAERAQKLLESTKKQNLAPGIFGGQIGGPIQIIPGPNGRIQIQGGNIKLPAGRIQIQGGGNIQIQVQQQFGAGGRKFRKKKIVNGVTETEIREGDIELKVVEDPKAGIKMDVTKTVKGKKETKNYAAKDLADLKKNHPEAHQLYAKYIDKAAGNPVAKAADDAKDADESEAKDPAEKADDKPAEEKDAIKKDATKKDATDKEDPPADAELDKALEELKKLRQQLNQLQTEE